jgi:hypothetical protein
VQNGGECRQIAHEVCAGAVGKEVEVGCPVGVRETIEGEVRDTFAVFFIILVKISVSSYKIKRCLCDVNSHY